METVAAVSFDGPGSRPIGWQMQQRVDHVVNRVMQTHRGESEDEIAQAIQDQLRSVGVVKNDRQIHQYATAIAQLPPLPPGRG